MRQSDTLVVKRDIICSNTKKKHWPRHENKGEIDPSWSFKEGDVQWVLKKDELYLENKVVLDVKVHCLYGSTLRCCFSVDEHLSSLKSHDHVNLLMVCIICNTPVLTPWY